MKKLIAFALAVTCLLSLCACNVKTDTSHENDSLTTTVPIETSVADALTTSESSTESSYTEDSTTTVVSTETTSAEDLTTSTTPTETSTVEASTAITVATTKSEASTSKPDADYMCYAEDGYYMISEVAKIIKTNGDDSKLFKEGVMGYEINDGVYYVDAETMIRISNTPCRGNGSVILKGWYDLSVGWGDHPDQFKDASASKINDAVYMSMYLPSEGRCFLNTQDRGFNTFPANNKYVNVCSIGAIYKNYDYELPDDASFTICISNATLLLCTKEKGWFVAEKLTYPDMPGCLYYLPWQLERELGVFAVEDRITYFDDHVEFKLKGSDLNAVEAKNVDSRVLECVLHFWGSQIKFENLGIKGSDISGVVSSFDVWVKEPEYANYFVIGVGADWRTSTGAINQVFESRKYTLTSEPKTTFAHSVSPSVYDEIMDTEFVKNALGLE